jgi:hypothetical protein
MSALGHVRFGPKADSCSATRHVRFTPNSGHVQRASSCLLWAKSGLMQCSKPSLFDHLVGDLLEMQRHSEA